MSTEPNNQNGSQESESTDHLLENLRDSAPDDEVEQLIDILERERRRRRDLEDTVDQLRREINRLRNSVGLSRDEEIDDPHFDHRDQAVLEVLAERNPDCISTSSLQTIYRKVTDVRQGETLKERIRDLTEYGPFEYDGAANWKYLADDEY